MEELKKEPTVVNSLMVNTLLQNLKQQGLQTNKSNLQDKVSYKCEKCKDKLGFWTKEGGYEFWHDCECMELERENRRLRFANIPDAYKDVRLSNYDLTLYSGADAILINKAYKFVQYYLDNFEEIKASGKGAYFYSVTKGSGKTRLVLSLANELIYEKKKAVKFATSIQIINEIKNTWNNETGNTESELIDQLCTTDILIIDDLGTEKTKDWIAERFYQIINERYNNKKITFVTSNYSLDDIDYDTRITERLSEMCYKVQFPNKSIRAIKSKENDDFLKQFL